MGPTRLFSRTLITCGLAACAAGAAQADPAAVELTQFRGAALAPAALPQAGTDVATQTMLWRQNGRVALGVGIEQRAVAPAGPGLQPGHGDAILVGLSLATSSRTRLSWQSVLPDHPTASLSEQPVKVSLSFQRSDSLRELRRGSLMRMELSGQTTLALKARGGRVGLALTSRW